MLNADEGDLTRTFFSIVTKKLHLEILESNSAMGI
jgi:hypothetical protein